MTAAATVEARVSERWLLTALVGLAVLVPLAIGAAAGTLEIPHNDDAAFRRAALGLFQTGRIELDGWGAMSLVGQLVFVQPFLWVSGGEAWAFAASTVMLWAVGIVSGYSLARRVISPARASLAVATLVLVPGICLNTTAFMTDVPALAMELLCLALGAVAISPRRAPRWGWLVAALAAGCFAFSIREFALAAPVAVLIAASASDRGRGLRYVRAGLALGVATGAIHLYTAHLPGQWASPITPSPGALTRLMQAAATLALTISPVTVIAAATWRGAWRKVDIGIGIAVGLAICSEPTLDVVETSVWPRMLIGNLLEPEGALGAVVSAGARPVLIGSPIWELMNALALVAAIVTCGVVAGILGALWRARGELPVSVRQTIGSTPGMLATFLALYGSGLAAYSILVCMFDRYLWPMVLPLAVLLLAQAQVLHRRAPAPAIERDRGIPVWAQALAGALLIGTGAISLVLTLNSVAFGAAKWRMGEELVQRGVPAESVDAGVEWVGLHAPGTAVPNTSLRDSRQMWYDAWWPAFRLCALVSSAPLDESGFRLETTDIAAYRLLLIAGPQTPLYAYRVANVGCR